MWTLVPVQPFKGLVRKLKESWEAEGIKEDWWIKVKPIFRSNVYLSEQGWIDHLRWVYCGESLSCDQRSESASPGRQSAVSSCDLSGNNCCARTPVLPACCSLKLAWCREWRWISWKVERGWCWCCEWCHPHQLTFCCSRSVLLTCDLLWDCSTVGRCVSRLIRGLIWHLNEIWLFFSSRGE